MPLLQYAPYGCNLSVISTYIKLYVLCSFNREDLYKILRYCHKIIIKTFKYTITKYTILLLEILKNLLF